MIVLELAKNKVNFFNKILKKNFSLKGAKSVIPFLVSTSIEASLNLSNFNQFVDFIHCLLDKMTAEHKHYLGKLSASQEEQRFF